MSNCSPSSLVDSTGAPSAWLPGLRAKPGGWVGTVAPPAASVPAAGTADPTAPLRPGEPDGVVADPGPAPAGSATALVGCELPTGSAPTGVVTSPSAGWGTKLENDADAPPRVRTISPVPFPRPGVGTGVVIRTAGAMAPLSICR